MSNSTKFWGYLIILFHIARLFDEQAINR